MNEGFKETEIGLIPYDWEFVKFKTVLKGGTRNGVYKSKEYHGTGVKIVNMGELFANPRLFSVPMKRLELKEEEFKRSSIEEGDLLFARRSLVAEGAGKCTLVCEVNEPTTFESSIIRARPNPKIADSSYLYYFLRSPYGEYLLDTIRRQVAVAGITGTDLVKLNIPLPSLNEQQNIGKFLSILDEKIRLNKQMNHTLEEISQAIFQHWFVNFEFPDDEKQPYKSNGGEMIDSELGEIPVGWEVKKLKECVEIIIDHRGKTPTKLGSEWSSSGIRALSAKNVKNGKIVNEESIKFVDEELYSKWMKDEIKREDILLTSEAPLGEFVSWDYDEKIVLSQRLFGIRANKQVMYPKYLYCFMKSGLFNYELKSRATGSTVQGIRQAELMKTNMLVPTLKLTSQFQNLISPLFNKITINEVESKNLSQIRDSLLPKLMSGKIRVKSGVDPK